MAAVSVTPLEEAEGKKLVIDEAGRVLTSDPRKIEPAYEVEDLVGRLAESLTGRSPRSVLLVGPAGVGKTAASHELVRRRDEFHLGATPFWSTSGARLAAGQSGFGAWQERCQRFCREAAKHRAVVHLGNLVELMEVGKGGMVAQGIASFLRPYVARGELLAVVECTPEQLPVIEKQDPHLLEVFHQLKVEEPTPEVGRAILRKSAEAWSWAFQVRKVDDEGLAVLDRLHRRYAGYSAYPGRPLRFLRNLINDLPAEVPSAVAGAGDVAAAFARETGLPPFMVDDAVPLDLPATRDTFAKRVIGQAEAVDLVTDLLATVKAGLTRPRRPIASLLFIGPTGVGKTEMAKALAAFLFGDAGRVSRFDMSEYADPVAVRRLVGDTFGAEGLLTAKVREQSFSVVLLDEFEKADPSFFDLLLQVLGEARLTDAAGRLAGFSNAIVVMTSNLGAESFQRGAFGLGAARGGGVRDAKAHFVEEVRSFLRPELFNRIDRVVPFLPLDEATVRAIVDRELALIARRDGFRLRGLELEMGPEVPAYLAAKGHDRLYGARPLKRVMERELLVPLADGANAYAEKTRLRAAVNLLPREGGLSVTVRARTDDGKSGDGKAGDGQPTTGPLALAALAERAARMRRDVQALHRSPAVLSLRNDLYAAEKLVTREARVRRKKKQPPAYDAEREQKVARMKAVAAAADDVAGRVTLLEDAALAALYEGEAVDRAQVDADLAHLSRDWDALLLSLYALRHPRPDYAFLGFYGPDAGHTLRLAAAYRAAAVGAFGSKVSVWWCERTQKRPYFRREQAESDAAGAAFLAEPRKGMLGIGLAITGPYSMPRFENEGGMHVMQVNERTVASVLVDASDAAGSRYKAPQGVNFRTIRTGLNGPLRRRYALDRPVVHDEALGRELRWDMKDLPGVIARAAEEQLEAVLRAMVR